MTYRSNGIVLHSPVVAPTGDVRREWYIVTDPLHGYRVSRAKAEEYENRTRANCPRYVHFEFKHISEMV